MNLIPDIAKAVAAKLEDAGYAVCRSYVPAITDEFLDQRLVQVRGGEATLDRSTGNNFFVDLQGGDVSGLLIIVCPSSLETELLNRGSDQDDLGIDVAVAARVSHPDATQEVDLLMSVPERLKSLLRGKLQPDGPEGTPHATWIGRRSALYDLKTLQERGVFVHKTTHLFRVLGAEAD